MLNQLGSVALTVYLKPDIAEVSQVLQLIEKQPRQLERFNAYLLPHEFTHIEGLESIDEPVSELAIVNTVNFRGELERSIGTGPPCEPNTNRRTDLIYVDTWIEDAPVVKLHIRCYISGSC